MRLGTWNVLHGAATATGPADVDGLAKAVDALDVDVLGLQEVDRAQPRSEGADLAAVAAEAMGAVEHRFAPTLHGVPGDWVPAPDPVGETTAGDTRPPPGTSPAYGIALVSRLPVVDWWVLPLPRLPRRVPLLLGSPRRPVLVRDEPRTALAARVVGPHGPVTVATTHLSFIPGWNLVQLRHLVRALRDEDPLVVTGDLNLGVRRARLGSGLPGLVAGLTFPADAPQRQIDHVLGRGVVATAPQVHHPPLSDHRALSATVVPAE
ncbi:endonuclease/exonuclease/phosphatase family protein [Actinomycetospora straminea]|uniref:Endonuclease/exonuclease/phosphatase family protein n=1 Tax=Actinomycetospora straminea TaxID=663607 RepID=A0ABP9ERQ5_9PSEU|nr:endonuclease/exonuclease/phosphatase family protein [Actinomycetospora straminea]MDD7931562.1 endonuclease/exonuclease/phosphatase family protein [Actinomycetospora straminea]